MIASITRRLSHVLSDCTPPPGTSLFSGTSGILLSEVVTATSAGGLPERFSDKLQDLAESALGHSYLPFCGGQAGVNWFFHFLSRQGILDAEDLTLITLEKSVFQERACQYLREGNYDFLHGAIGIVYYLLSIHPDSSDPFYATFFQMLEANLANAYRMVQDYDSKTRAVAPGKINLGLAHGIPSILKCCLQSYKQGLCTQVARRIGEAIIEYLLRNVNQDRNASWYPTSIYSIDPKHGWSRLAWCYGDLTLGYVLYQAGIAFDYPSARDFALDLLHHTTSRRTLESTLVYDAGVCHGSSGVAHVYNRLWHATGDPMFQEATEFWIQKTLDFAVHEDGAAGYKKFNPGQQQWTTEYSLLEGAAGIQLVLHSYQTGDFDWDYCLMLND